MSNIQNNIKTVMFCLWNSKHERRMKEEWNDMVIVVEERKEGQIYVSTKYCNTCVVLTITFTWSGVYTQFECKLINGSKHNSIIFTSNKNSNSSNNYYITTIFLHY